MSISSASPAAAPAGKPRLSAEDWILAGHQVLIAEGIEGVKIDRVAGQLGVTKGSFYWHFKSLAAFQHDMVLRFIADGQQMMDSFEQTAPSDPRERLLSMMNRISDTEVGYLERAMRNWVYLEDDLDIHFERADRWGFGVVKDAFEKLGFAGHDAEVRAKALYYAGVGRLHSGVLGERETLEHREALLDILTRR